MKQQEAPGSPKSPRRPQARRTQNAPGRTRKLPEALGNPKEPSRRPTRRSQKATRGDRWVAHAQQPHLRTTNKASEKQILDAKTSL